MFTFHDEKKHEKTQSNSNKSSFKGEILTWEKKERRVQLQKLCSSQKRHHPLPPSAFRVCLGRGKRPPVGLNTAPLQEAMSFSWTAILGSLSLLSALTVAALLRWLPKRSNTITVVVLGDVARSPRMCNHVRSLLSQGWTVLFVGYLGGHLVPDCNLAK